MKNIEVWSVEIGSTMHTAESKTYHVQASNPGTAAKRALAIARKNGFSEWSKREKQSLFVRSASFETYVYLA